jgi:hypothetical protein
MEQHWFILVKKAKLTDFNERCNLFTSLKCEIQPVQPLKSLVPPKRALTESLELIPPCSTEQHWFTF